MNDQFERLKSEKNWAARLYGHLACVLRYWSLLLFLTSAIASNMFHLFTMVALNLSFIPLLVNSFQIH